MSNSVKCITCGEVYVVAEHETGKSVSCKKCGAIFVAPSAESDDDFDEYSLSPLDNAPAQPKPQPPSQSLPATMSPSAGQSSSPSPASPSPSPSSQAPAAQAGTPPASLTTAASSAFAETPQAGNTTTCYECGHKLPANAVLCTSCGMNLKTGKQLATKSAGADGAIYITASFIVRSCLIFAAIFFGFVALGTFAVWESMDKDRAVTGGIAIIAALLTVATASIAFRNSKHLSLVSEDGGRKLIISRALGVFTFKRKLELGQYDTVWFIQKPRNVGATTMLFVIATGLIFVGVVPGLLFWYHLVMNSDDTSVNYRAELRGAGGLRTVIHRGGEASKHDVNGIVTLLHSTAGLAKEQEIGLLD